MKNTSALVFFFLLVFSNNIFSQTLHEVQFTTEDGIEISAAFQYPKNQSQAVPAIILIHQGGSSREEWLELELWNQLLDAGYALLAYDVRLHGKSAKDEGDLYDLFNNPTRAPYDLQAAIHFLEKDVKIDAQRIGILGASIGANLACVAAASEQYNVQSVVSMSAKTSAAQNLSGTDFPLSLKNAFLIASSKEQDGKRATWAYELFAKTSGTKKVSIAKGKEHGSFILREDKALSDSILEWFKKTL